MSRETDVRAAGPVVLLAGLVVVASLTTTITQGLTTTVAGIEDPLDAIRSCIAFALFIAVGEVMRLTLPGGRQSAPLASAGALAFALLPTWPGLQGDLGVPVALAVTVVTVGSVIGSVPRAFAGRSVMVEELARRVLATVVASYLFHAMLQRLVDGGITDAGFRPDGTPSPVAQPGWMAVAMAIAAAGRLDHRRPARGRPALEQRPCPVPYRRRR